jgi:hypothetical protein
MDFTRNDLQESVLRGRMKGSESGQLHQTFQRLSPIFGEILAYNFQVTLFLMEPSKL